MKVHFEYAAGLSKPLHCVLEYSPKEPAAFDDPAWPAIMELVDVFCESVSIFEIMNNDLFPIIEEQALRAFDD